MRSQTPRPLERWVATPRPLIRALVHYERMPERTVTGLTQGMLKFAAGNDATREQVSSTWCARFTRGAELYLFSRELGGNRAHISFHKDGRCHYKVEDPDAGGRKIAEWELPEPMEETGMRRLATIRIPHRGLVVPDGFSGPDDETVLIPPPPESHQLDVDILFEPGEVTQDVWPGQTGRGSLLVGRFSLYTDSSDIGFMHFTFVSTLRPEAKSVRLVSEASIAVAEGIDPPVRPRVVLFEGVTVDGQHLPVLTEMPVGHMRPDKV